MTNNAQGRLFVCCRDDVIPVCGHVLPIDPHASRNRIVLADFTHMDQGASVPISGGGPPARCV